MLTVEAHAALEPLGAEWQALVDRAPEATVFQSWEWIATFWKHRGRGQLFVLVAREAGRMVGILPLAIARYRGLPLRRVSFLGAPLSDYQDLISEAGRAAECAGAFFAHLREHAARWDLVDLADVREDSALAQMQMPGLIVAPHRICPFLALPASWENYQQTLGRNLRGNLGRKRRQLEARLGARFDTVPAGEIEPALETLYRLHNRRWRRRGLAGAFAAEGVRSFHREVAPLLAARGWLRLHRLQAGGATRAVLYCFGHRGRVYYYLGGFDLALSNYGPGNLLLAHAIAQAIDEGAAELDFLRGDEHYKFEWGARERRTVRLVWAHPTVRATLARGLNRIEREAEALGSRLRNRLWGRPTATKAGRPGRR
jgi:CelD/BcsL family acetyltransferase involved in cellulose biosynthesis